MPHSLFWAWLGIRDEWVELVPIHLPLSWVAHNTAAQPSCRSLFTRKEGENSNSDFVSLVVWPHLSVYCNVLRTTFVSWLVWWFQSNSSDTSGEFHPIEVPACAEGQSLPRYEVSHAWFLIVYMLSLFLVDFLPTLLSQPFTPSCRGMHRWRSYCPWCASCWQVCPSILVLSARTNVSCTVFFFS